MAVFFASAKQGVRKLRSARGCLAYRTRSRRPSLRQERKDSGFRDRVRLLITQAPMAPSNLKSRVGADGTIKSQIEYLLVPSIRSTRLHPAPSLRYFLALLLAASIPDEHEAKNKDGVDEHGRDRAGHARVQGGQVQPAQGPRHRQLLVDSSGPPPSASAATTGPSAFIPTGCNRRRTTRRPSSSS